jgi:organic radical activating enzyme
VKTYSVKKIFGPTLQGEGHRAGTVTLFLRFAGCNLQCVDAEELDRKMEGLEIDVGFMCDTDFKGGERLGIPEILRTLAMLWGNRPHANRAVVISGGEPTLQLDRELLYALRGDGWYTAVETNGTSGDEVLDAADWISCSPKGPTRLRRADEVRCVVSPGNPPDDRGIESRHAAELHRFASPAWAPQDSDSSSNLWCAINWCKENPAWRLSVQQHKAWDVE